MPQRKLYLPSTAQRQPTIEGDAAASWNMIDKGYMDQPFRVLFSEGMQFRIQNAKCQ